MILILGGAFQGKTEFADTFTGKKMFNVHEVIKKSLISGKEINCDLNKFDVITCDEVGSGIIPMDKFEREYREKVGRICCEIAKNATEVYRVTAGIPMKIKG